MGSCRRSVTGRESRAASGGKSVAAELHTCAEMVAGPAIRRACSCVVKPGPYQETAIVGPDRLREFSMRVASRLSTLVAALAAWATPGVAADLSTRVPAAQPIMAAPLQPLSLWELRLGGSAQDPSGPESGSFNVTGEILSPRLGS